MNTPVKCTTGASLAYLSILFIATIAAFMPSLHELHAYWIKLTETYAHGYLVLGISVYLLAINRKLILCDFTKPPVLAIAAGLMGVFLLSIIYTLAFTTQILVIQLAASIVILWLWISVTFGVSAAKNAAIPVGIMLMAIPLWEGLVEILRTMTTVVTESGLHFIGIIAYINEFSVILSTGVIEIAESCSGLKYLLAGLTLSIVYAELNFESIKKKLLVVATGIFISIAANWIRVFLIVVIADMTDMQHSLVRDHENFGWVVFSICFMLFLLVCSKIPGDLKKTEIDESQKQQATSLEDDSARLKRALAVTLLALALPVYALINSTAGSAGQLAYAVEHDGLVELYTGWTPAYEGYDESRVYGIQGTDRQLSLLIYKTQHQGKEMIYWSNSLGGEEFTSKDAGEISANGNKLANLVILEDEKSLARKKRLVAWFYKVGDELALNDVDAKLKQFKSVMLGRPISSIVAISTICETSCNEEIMQWRDQQIVPDLQARIVIQ